MSDTVNHQADPPGVTWDVTIDGHRYLVIEEPVVTDCGYTGSRESNYTNGRCRCDTCRDGHRLAAQRRNQTRRKTQP